MHGFGFFSLLLFCCSLGCFFNFVEPLKETEIVRKIKQDKTIGCKVSKDLATTDTVWLFQKDKDDKPTQLVLDAVKYISNGQNLTIKAIEESQLGIYTCQLNLNDSKSGKAEIQVVAKPWIKHVRKSENGVDGDSVEIKCEAHGSPKITMKWMVDGTEIDTAANPRFTLKPNANSSKEGQQTLHTTLRIEKLEKSDRNNYMCIATSDYGTSNHTTLLRVKDKLAALWPFLGICAEVVILCAIIFLYERHRSKQASKDDDNYAETEAMTNSHDHRKDDIRQRKS